MLEQVEQIDKGFIEQKAYQQALSDFGIEELLEKISNYCDEDFDAGKMHLEQQELESLAGILLMNFIKGINGKQISGCLNATRHGNSDLMPNSLSQEIQLPLVGLPSNFPNVETPQYSEGENVRWKSTHEKTDFGIVLGRFYAYASHIGRWSWKYVVLLDKNSPSSAWVNSDTAWEEDLEEMEHEK